MTPEEDERNVTDRWWIDLDRERSSPGRSFSPELAGRRFYVAGEGYDQDSAHARLTDINLKILREADPQPGEWHVLTFVDAPFPEERRRRILEEVRLPEYARGTVVDSGSSLRLIVTGTPIGERVLELVLTEPPAFDCWVEGEWLREEIYSGRKEALAAFRKKIPEYLSPEAIDYWHARLHRI